MSKKGPKQPKAPKQPKVPKAPKAPTGAQRALFPWRKSGREK